MSCSKGALWNPRVLAPIAGVNAGWDCSRRHPGWSTPAQKPPRGLWLPSCNPLLSETGSSAAARLKGPLQPHGELPNLNYNYLNYFSCIALQFFLGFSLTGPLWWKNSLCVQEMRNICPRPVLPLRWEVWNLFQWVANKLNSRNGLLGKSFPGAVCQLLTAESACQGMLKAERYKTVIMIFLRSCFAFRSARLVGPTC